MGLLNRNYYFGPLKQFYGWDRAFSLVFGAGQVAIVAERVAASSVGTSALPYRVMLNGEAGSMPSGHNCNCLEHVLPDFKELELTDFGKHVADGGGFRVTDIAAGPIGKDSGELRA